MLGVREPGEDMQTDTVEIPVSAWRVVVLSIQELSEEALYELLGAATYEHIRRENLRAKRAIYLRANPRRSA